MPEAGHSNQRIAYLADGRLFLKVGSAEPHEVLCTNAEILRERMAKLHQQSDWKHPSGSSVSEALVLGDRSHGEGHIGTEIAAIAPSDQEGELLYGLNTDDVAGIFLRPIRQNADERRLIHTTESNIHTLSAPDKEGRVACSISRLDGLQNLSIYRIGSPGLTEITEGDSLDAAASWIPGKDGQLVYQSAGIGRNGNGQWVATGPATIELLDTTRGEISTLLGDSQHDYLSPQVDQESQLYCIRRPYKGGGLLGLQTLAGSWLRAPSRLCRSIASWFGSGVSRKPGAPISPLDPSPSELGPALIPGNLIDMRRLREDAALRGEIDTDIVPRSWQLIRTDLERPHSGTAEILAKGVIAFHVSADGVIFYSDGSAILKLSPGCGKPEPVEPVHNVQQILAF
jgi:hypothetical protein